MDKRPTKGAYLETILRSPKTIFSIKDVALMWGDDNESIIRLNKYQKAGKLIRVRRGFYAKENKYNRFELVTRGCEEFCVNR